VRKAAIYLLFGLAGCGRTGPFGGSLQPASLPSEPAVRLEDLHPYFVAGEQITWSVTLLGVEGVRARLAVGQPGIEKGRRVVAVAAQAESAGILAAVKKVRDSVSSWIDVESGIPTRTISEVEMKGKTLEVQAIRRSRQPVADLVVKRGKGARELKESKRLPSFETHDPLSAILVLRNWTAANGSRAVFTTLGGLRIWRTDVVVEGREELSGPLGKRQTIRIAGVSRRMIGNRPDRRHKPRTFTLWLSEDPERIPLKIIATTEYGEILVSATSYEAPMLGRR